MIGAVLSTMICVLFFVLLCAFGYRFIYYALKKRQYRMAHQDDALFARLQAEYQKARIPFFRNYLLYLILRTAHARGEEEKCRRLRPFLQRDFFCDFSDIFEELGQ